MEESELLKKRREKVRELAASGVVLYNDLAEADSTSADLIERFGCQEAGKLAGLEDKFSLAGRIMAVRNFGKATFLSLQDRKGRIQVYLNRDRIGQDRYLLFKKLDIGDIIGVKGGVFRTKTGELTIDADGFTLLAKSVRPLPEKWHGLTDIETRYRQRHLDLIMNPGVKEVFYTRSRIIRLLRQFMTERDFLEVETPMMQPRAGGAVARPFKTYHNALGIDLYLRIAPELYLKRLVTGGLERVFEINRSFRNEGISILHNPEFTMMEFYQAYATYRELMDLTEELFLFLAREILGSTKLTYQGNLIDLAPPWRRISVREAVREATGLPEEALEDRESLSACAKGAGLDPGEGEPAGRLIMALFEALVEERLIQPTFVTGYPVEVSPLARRCNDDPSLTDRFELYINGREIANAFTELNDPVDQRERFLQQLAARERGDEEAHDLDEDYIRTLEYGMPPAAGEGIGIDRLVMLFTDSPSIRDVILFPQMRSRED